MTSVTKMWAFGLIIATTIFTTLAQFFLKTGAGEPSVLNPWLFVGLALYAVGSIIMLLAFKGGDVSALYPVIATSYVWVALLSRFWFGEEVHFFRWLGIATIIAGITIIGFSSAEASRAH